MLDLEAIDQRRHELLAERSAAAAAEAQAAERLDTVEDALVHEIAAQEALQGIAAAVQDAAHARIAGVVSECLGAVFDDPYEFRILFNRARGRTEARLVFVRDGQEINPIDSSGGGVIDVAAFALQVACLMLSRPPARRVMVLDEPFKFVSARYVPRVREMLERLSEELRIQFIMVTHIPELRCGKVIEV